MMKRLNALGEAAWNGTLVLLRGAWVLLAFAAGIMIAGFVSGRLISPDTLTTWALTLMALGADCRNRSGNWICCFGCHYNATVTVLAGGDWSGVAGRHPLATHETNKQAIK